MIDHCNQKKCPIKMLFGSREDLESASHATLHHIWNWAKKIKADTLMRLRKEEEDILQLEERHFKVENGVYLPSDPALPLGISLFNLFGLIDSNISGEIFLIDSEAFKELPKELELVTDLNVKQPIYHYLIGLSNFCENGIEESSLAALLDKFVEHQKNKIIDIEVEFDFIPRKAIKNSADKIIAMKSRIDKLKSSQKFKTLFNGLYNELNGCQKLIDVYLNPDNQV